MHPSPRRVYRNAAIHIVQMNLRSPAVDHRLQAVPARGAKRVPEVRIDPAAQIARRHARARAARNRKFDGSVHRAQRNRVLPADPVEAGLQLPVDGGEVHLSFQFVGLDAPIDRRRLHLPRHPADRKPAVDQFHILQAGAARHRDAVLTLAGRSASDPAYWVWMETRPEEESTITRASSRRLGSAERLMASTRTSSRSHPVMLTSP